MDESPESRSGPDVPPASGADRFWEAFGETSRGEGSPRSAPRAANGPGEAAREDERQSGGFTTEPPPPRERRFEAPPLSADERADHECLDWCPICRAADVLRAAATPELRDQLQHVQHDTLLAFRSLLDSYIERLDGERHRATPVEDIPIE